MTKKAEITLILTIAALLAMSAATPFLLRTGALTWEKHSARKIFDRLTPEERRNLNVVPTMVELPAAKIDAKAVVILDFGGYLLRVPAPTKYDQEPKLIRLTYPRFRVFILKPFSMTSADWAARQLHFRDWFDERSAAYHAHLDDLDAVRDPPSLRRFLLLMSDKVSRTYCQEQFTCGDLRGFILSPLPDGNRTVVSVESRPSHAGFGVWFIDPGGLTLQDIHVFLGELRMEQKQTEPVQGRPNSVHQTRPDLSPSAAPR